MLLSHHCHIFVTVTFPCISQTIEVQISYPETSPESREPELSFDTRLNGVSGFFDGDIGSLKSAPFYSADPVASSPHFCRQNLIFFIQFKGILNAKSLKVIFK